MQDHSNRQESLELSYSLITRTYSSGASSEIEDELKTFVHKIPSSIKILYEDLSAHKSLRLIYKCL